MVVEAHKSINRENYAATHFTPLIGLWQWEKI